MANRSAVAALVACSCALIGTAALGGCGRGADESVEVATPTSSRLMVAAEATDTAEPTSESEATAAAATLAAAPAAVENVTATTAGVTMLPADPDAVLVQFARIEPSPWEPEILGQMRPHFSLQANGYGVFSSWYGDSETGWYQTAITPSNGLDFLKLLMDDIDVLDLATRHGISAADYETAIDGSPSGTGVIGVIYVHAMGREGRLVIPEKDMESPSAGADHDRLAKLHSVVLAMEVWKQGLFREFTVDEKLAVASVLNWWSDIRLPYTPESGVMYGTRARANIPADRAVAVWPMAEPELPAAFDASYGSEPAELLLRDADLRTVLAAERARPDSYWGPLWKSSGGTDLYLARTRVGVPGSNQCVVDYTFRVPLRSIGPATPTATP